MSSYSLFGYQIEISSGKRNYSYLSVKIIKHMDNCRNIFRESYTKNYPGEKDFGPKVWQYAIGAMNVAAEDFLSLLKANHIYTVSKEDLLSEENTERFANAVTDIMIQISEISGNAEAAREYRSQRKASRSRAGAVGFGVPAYIKASVDAAAINAVTGIGHSMINAIGNAGTSLAASANINSLIRNNETVNRLAEAVSGSISLMGAAVMSYLKDYGMEFEILPQSNSEKAYRILKNINSIPNDDKKNALIQAITLDYCNQDIYTYIIEHYPEESRTVDQMATELGMDVSEPIKNRINAKAWNLAFKISCFHKSVFCSYDEAVWIYQEYEALRKMADDTGWSEDLITVRIPAFIMVRGLIESIPEVYLKHDFNEKEEFLICIKELEGFYGDIRFRNLDDPVEYADIEVSFDKYSTLNLYHYQFLENRLEYLKRVKGIGLTKELHNLIADRKYSDLFEISGITDKFEKRKAQVCKYAPFEKDEQLFIVVYTGINQGLAITSKRVLLFDHMLSKKECEQPIEESSSIFSNSNGIYLSGSGVSGSTDLVIKLSLADEKDRNSCIFDINNLLNVIKYHLGTDKKDALTSSEGPIYTKAEQAETLRCTGCGKEVPKSAKFCTFCGNVMQAQKMETMFCTGCGKKILRTTKFCTYCGTQNTYRKERGV